MTTTVNPAWPGRLRDAINRLHNYVVSDDLREIKNFIEAQLAAEAPVAAHDAKTIDKLESDLSNAAHLLKEKDEQIAKLESNVAELEDLHFAVKDQRDRLQKNAATPATDHPDDLAVDRFAAAMKAKMAASRAKGRNGWNNPDLCPVERLQGMLLDHLVKGDPVDIGNFSMMLFNRNAPVSAAAPAAVKEPADLPAWTPEQVEFVHADAKDAARYAYVIECDYIAAKKYLPNLNEAEYKAKLRKKHDAALANK